MAVVLDLTQSGSGSTKISASSGDTITIAIADTTSGHEAALEWATTSLGALTAITGVTFAVSLTGNAS